MEGFVDEHGLAHFPHAVDEDGSLWGHFGVPYQPAWVFLDDTGEVTRHVGTLAEAELEQILERMIAS
jgi:hypothetical protein